jgi:hypothetical protein
MPLGALGEWIGSGLSSWLGSSTADLIGSALAGSGLGAATAAITGGDPAAGAIGGAVTGGLQSELGGTNGILTDEIGTTATDALTGALGGTVGAVATGQKNIPAAAGIGAGAGALEGLLGSSGLLGNSDNTDPTQAASSNISNAPTSNKTDWSQFLNHPGSTLLSAAQNNAQYVAAPALNIAASLLKPQQTNPLASQVVPVAAAPTAVATTQNTPLPYQGLPNWALDYERYQGKLNG